MDDEPNIETVEAKIGSDPAALIRDEPERAVYVLGLAVGLARRHRAERDRLRAVVEIANRVVDRRDPEQWSLDHDAFVDLGVALDQFDVGGEPTAPHMQGIDYWKRLHDHQVERRLQAEVKWSEAADEWLDAEGELREKWQADVAERDRLRLELDDWQELTHSLMAESVAEVAERVRELIAERDQLRAVVESAREFQRRIVVGTVHLVGDQGAAERLAEALHPLVTSVDPPDEFPPNGTISRLPGESPAERESEDQT